MGKTNPAHAVTGSKLATRSLRRAVRTLKRN